MPAPKPFDILVLGPMVLRQRGMVASEPRTRDLKRLIESIVADIQTERGAGYYANSVHRFVRPGGFFHKPRRIVPGPRAAQGDAPAERTMRIEHYFAVSPPGGLTRAQSEDATELEQALASWGLRLHFVTIQRLPDDDEDMRDFGASLLGRDGDPNRFHMVTLSELGDALPAIGVTR